MTLAEAAASLGVAPATLRRQIALGALTATKQYGRDWWVEDAEVERYRRSSLGRPGRRTKAKPAVIDVDAMCAAIEAHVEDWDRIPISYQNPDPHRCSGICAADIVARMG